MPRIELYEGSQKIADIGLPEKKFSTGSVGYWATQKLEINGKRYQCQFQLVEIGSRAPQAIVPIFSIALLTSPCIFAKILPRWNS